MYKIDRTKPTNPWRKRLLLIAPIVIVVLLTGGYVLQRNNIKMQTQQATPKDQPFITDPSPESKAVDKVAGDEQKQAIQKDGTVAPSPTQPAPGTKQQVKPIITWASGATINAFIPSISEDGGSCTLTLTKAGSASVTKTQPATFSGQNTTCQPFIMDTTYSGWSATVSYSSANSQGTSDSKGVQ